MNRILLPCVLAGLAVPASAPVEPDAVDPYTRVARTDAAASRSGWHPRSRLQKQEIADRGDASTSVVGNLAVLSTKSVLKRAKNAAHDRRIRF